MTLSQAPDIILDKEQLYMYLLPPCVKKYTGKIKVNKFILIADDIKASGLCGCDLWCTDFDL